MHKPIIRVHILDPAALTTSSQALVSFWPYGDVGAGYVTPAQTLKGSSLKF